jgi:putative DNA primase/helicase
MPQRPPKIRKKTQNVTTGSPYYIGGDGLMKKLDSEDGEPTRIGRRIEVTGIRCDLDTGEVLLELSFDYAGESHTRVVSRGMLTRRRISELMAFGADVADHRVDDVLQWLTHQEETAPVTLVHTRLGWDEVDGRLVFKHATGLGLDSTYNGPLLIQPHGEPGDWFDLVRGHVLGHTPAELAVVMGLAAPLASLVSRETGLVDVAVVHLHGDSTQGKSTATGLAVSTFGCPDLKREGLFKTWDGTDNAVSSHFRGNHGVPAALDEASVKGEKDFSHLIYRMATGPEKARLDRDGNHRKSETWSGLFMSNAEYSLLGKSNQNVGLRVRLIEFGNIEWTKSKDHANALGEGVRRSYGHAGPLFVRHLIALGPEKVVEHWNAWRDRIQSRIKVPDRFTDRVAKKLALLMATADLAGEALGLKFDTEAILQLLLQVEEQAADSRDLPENAYRHLLDSVARYGNRFPEEDSGDPGHELWGRRVVVDGRAVQVFVLQDRFRALMAEGGFTNPDVVLKAWRDRDLLVCERGRYTRKKSIGGIETRVYAVKLRESSFDVESLPTDPRRTRKILGVELP